MVTDLLTIKKNPLLEKYLRNLLGNEYENFLCASPEPRCIRLNAIKPAYVYVLRNLIDLGAEFTPIDFSDWGYSITSEQNNISQSLDFFKGNFTFQGASSQLPPIILDPRPCEKVLDMAASPGSKTTQLAALMQNKGILIVNDSNRNRMTALNANTQRCGVFNHCIYYLEGERLGRLFPQYFDKVLLDTPCSGLGTLATQKEIVNWWHPVKLKNLVNTQRQLLISAIKATKVGGTIVYSTCSIAPEENEMIINEMIAKYPVRIEPIDIPTHEAFSDGWVDYDKQVFDLSLKNCKRVWPQLHAMEGFFVAKLIKTADYYNKNDRIDAEFFETKPHNDPAVKTILKSISKTWGIDFDFWQNYRYYLTKSRIWLFGLDVIKILKKGFTNGGLLLADDKLHLWKLSHQAVQLIGNKITRRRLNLNPYEVKILFSKGSCAAPEKMPGYFALELAGVPSAIVYFQDDQIKIKLSHNYYLK